MRVFCSGASIFVMQTSSWDSVVDPTRISRPVAEQVVLTDRMICGCLGTTQFLFSGVSRGTKSTITHVVSQLLMSVVSGGPFFSQNILCTLRDPASANTRSMDCLIVV